MNDVKKTDVIGKTITSLLRTEYEIALADGTPNSKEMQFCRYFLELDGRCLVELGYHRECDRLAAIVVVPQPLVPCECTGSTCIGCVIADVLAGAVYPTIFIVLTDGRFLWHEHEEWGSMLFCEDKEYFGGPFQMVPYWTE